MSDIENRGSGAGGENTNRNGIRLEEKTRETISGIVETMGLSSEYNSGTRSWKVEEVTYQGDTYIRCPETAFKLFEDKEGNSDVPQAHGAKEPDDLLVNKVTKTINWVECKVQNGSGSVVEKLQTASEKIENLKRRFPGWNINYVYVLSSYFREHAQWEISRLDEKNILYIFEDDEDFEGKLMDYSFK